MLRCPEDWDCQAAAAFVVSLIATETGHTGRNQSAAFSSLPIFNVSRGQPRALLQCP